MISFVQYIKKRWVILPWVIAGGVVMTLFTCSNCRTSFPDFASIATLTVICWGLMWFGNEFLHEYLDDKIDWTKHPVKRLTVGLMALTIYTVGATYIVMNIARPVLQLSKGTVTGTVYISMGITLVISVILTSRSFLYNWRQTAIEAEKFQRQSVIAQFESLRSQVNPHFLFNALNALTNLVYEDQDKAAKFIKQLSQVYRYLLDTRDKEIVPLEEEKKFLDSYLFLQQIRFGDKLRLDVSLDNTSGMVAPLVLQMLVENAIKHNEISQASPLTVRIFVEGNYLVVENNLQKKQFEEASSGVGLANICQRYEFLTEHKVEVILNDKFIVRIPLLAQPL